MEKILQTLNMCDFCAHERDQCDADPTFSRDITLTNGNRLETQNAVVACDKYESPVEMLKQKFH